jgi:hypothetical protein
MISGIRQRHPRFTRALGHYGEALVDVGFAHSSLPEGVYRFITQQKRDKKKLAE